MSSRVNDIDVALIGGGVMSASLGVLLRHVRPDWRIVAFERLEAVGEESSGTWNNAGTGHAALCEMNYTPQLLDGSIDISKALVVNEQFHATRQLWASLVERGAIETPESFINPVPHMSVVMGDSDIDFLRKRHELLAATNLFHDLEYSEDLDQIREWLPLMMEGRDESQKIAVTRSMMGTDVDYGSLVRQLFGYLESEGVPVHLRHQVESLSRLGRSGSWSIGVQNLANGERTTHRARFVFVGAGGTALHLLQKAGIPEIEGYGGFPVSGHFLHCRVPEVVERHQAKAYGKSTLAAPPMAMPHLDRRLINGEPGLLFGPYAGFTPKYLKRGSIFDLARSVKRHNLMTMLTVAKNERALTWYLIKQILQSGDNRIDVLRNFVPTAKAEEWELKTAGQRVQTMKRTATRRGALEFGTETVVHKDGSIAGVLGASPGASVAVSIMLDLMQKCFREEYPAWVPKLQEIIPSVGHSLENEPDLLAQIEASTDIALHLNRAPA